jgi:hypothetical protein
MTESLGENFKTKFTDFPSQVTNTIVFKNPFSVDVSHAPEKLLLVFIELQYDSNFRSSFNQKALNMKCVRFIL